MRRVKTEWSKRPVDLIFPRGYAMKTSGRCPTCRKRITQIEVDGFTETEWKEYQISGMCQRCQRSAFK